MPIKPENKALYPAGKEWKAIREEILARAGNKCEWPGCGVENGALGLRDPEGNFVSESQMSGYDVDCFRGARPLRIVLTIALFVIVVVSVIASVCWRLAPNSSIVNTTSFWWIAVTRMRPTI